MISVRGLKRKYGDTVAIGGIDVEVPENEIFGIVGPDGAGKTTLLRLMATLLLPDAGTITIDGFNTVSEYRHVRDRIGYMPGRFSLYQDLTVEENLDFFATVFGTTIKENYDLIADIYRQIEPFKDRRAGALSGGMKQKLALSCALIHKPRVLFLDEPTTGVDPVSRREFWDMLGRLRQRGLTILVSTPYMDEASRCDRIALMQEGLFLKIDTPRGIIEGFRSELWAVRADAMSKLLRELRGREDVATCFAFGDAHHITFKKASPDPSFFRASLESAGYRDIQIDRIQPTIEDCFMAVAGETIIR